MELKLPVNLTPNNPISFFIFFVIGFFVCFFLKQCNEKPDFTTPVTHTHSTDTVITYLPGDTVQIIVTKTKYKNVVSVRELNAYIDSIRFYVDTNRIDSTSYAVQKDSVAGKKIWSQFKYFGRPYIKQVTVTNTDSTTQVISVPAYKRGLFLEGEVGGNNTSFNYSVGVSFISKKKWAVGYRYGINQRTQNLSLKYRIL